MKPNYHRQSDAMARAEMEVQAGRGEWGGNVNGAYGERGTAGESAVRKGP